MSVDLSVILPNNCQDLHDNAQALDTLHKTISRIKEYFGGREGFVEDIEICNSDSPDWDEDDDPKEVPGRYSFELPILHATCNLNQGYWDIWAMARYSSYFWPSSKCINGNIRLWAREDAFDIARIFGFAEGWICDEYHSWNSLLDEDKTADFQKWCAYGEDTEDAKVHEFFLDMFEGRLERFCDYHSKYHDNFEECHALVAAYEQMYSDYRILTLGRPADGFALVDKGKELYVLNLKTGENLTPFPIDCCHSNFNGAGFTVSRGKKRAFFNRKGKQLTDFREGNFSWKWAGGCCLRQVIVDHASGRHFLTDGTEVPSDDE